MINTHVYKNTKKKHGILLIYLKNSSYLNNIIILYNLQIFSIFDQS